MVDEFGFEEPDLRLGEGVEVGAADGADGRIDAFVDKPAGEGIDA